MQLSQQYASGTVQSVLNFVHDNAGKLGSVASSGAKQQLEGLRAELVGHQSAQVDRSRQAHAATQVHYGNRRALLRQHMAAIAAVAKAEAAQHPALGVLRMPKVQSNISTLLTSANTMRSGAQEHADVFITAGLPVDFIAQLDSAIADMLQALEERKDVFGKAVGATKGIRTTVTAARQQIQILDKLVRNALAGDESLLRNWDQVKRVRRVSRADSHQVPGRPSATWRTLDSRRHRAPWTGDPTAPARPLHP